MSNFWGAIRGVLKGKLAFLYYDDLSFAELYIDEDSNIALVINSPDGDVFPDCCIDVDSVLSKKWVIKDNKEVV